MIGQGLFVEDPEGLLWLDDKMRALVKDLNEDERISSLLKAKAKDEHDFNKGCWSYLYAKYKGDEGFTMNEVNEAVTVLIGWNEGADENQMDEWRMKLRLH